MTKLNNQIDRAEMRQSFDHDIGDNVVTNNVVHLTSVSSANDGLSDIIKQIRKLNPSDGNGKKRLLSIAHQAGAEWPSWSYSFDDVLIQMQKAALDTGFNVDFLFRSLDRSMLEGLGNQPF